MTIYFHQKGIMNGSNCIKNPLRSNAILNIENNDKYCFIWSVLGSLHTSNICHPIRVSNYEQYFDELNIQGLDGYKCSDVQKFEKLNNLSINIFELIFLSRSE